MWRIRESGPRAAAAAPGAPLEWEGWDDAAVAPEKLGRVSARSARAAGRVSLPHRPSTVTSATAAFTCRSSFDLETEQGIRKYGEFVDRAADLVVWYGGSLSGEHGDGQSRGALLPKMFGDELMGAFREFKSVWDPDNKMNPAQARRRLSADREPPAGRRLHAATAATHFAFPDDGGSFERAIAAMHRPGRVPQARFRNDVPELHGDARGRAQHARPRAHAVRDAAGRGGAAAAGRTSTSSGRSTSACPARRASRSARPTSTSPPIAPSSSRITTKAERARSTRTRSAWSIAGCELAAIAPPARELRDPASRASAMIVQPRPAHRARASAAAGSRPVNFRKWARRQRRAPRRKRRSANRPSCRPTSSCGWTRSTTTFTRRRARPRSTCCRRPGIRRRHPAQRACAAAGRSTTSACSIARRQYLQTVMDSARRGHRCGRADRRARAELRVGVPRRAPQPVSGRRSRATRLRSQTFLLSEFLESGARALSSRRVSRGKVLLHGHCHHKALMKMGHEESLLRKMGADVQSPGRRLLRHGGRVRIRGREIRRVAGDRRARPAAGRAHGRRRTR